MSKTGRIGQEDRTGQALLLRGDGDAAAPSRTHRWTPTTRPTAGLLQRCQRRPAALQGLALQHAWNPSRPIINIITIHT